ncbi:hypothetical protein EV121DRAFT_288276 [Schizophyllum commune]
MAGRLSLTASGLEPAFDAAYHRRRRTVKGVRDDAEKWLAHWSTRYRAANERNVSTLYGREEEEEAQDGIQTALIICPMCECVNYRPCSLNCSHVMCAFCVVSLLAGTSKPPSQKRADSFCAKCRDRNHLSTKPICLESLGEAIEVLCRQLSLQQPRSLPTYAECNNLIASFYALVFTPSSGLPTHKAVG